MNRTRYTFECVLLSTLIVITIIVMQLGTSDACGMTTHNEIARRAFNFSNFQGFEEIGQLIPQYLPTFQAGAAFPDWGYNCGNMHDESEAAHWPPFLRNATVYLLKTYPKPWSEEGQRLAVFLMGVLSHQVADISWHSIAGLQEGLIEAMAYQDFNETYSTAHTSADIGGEFVLAYNYDLSWLQDEWYVPVGDVKEIYKMMNYDVDEFTLVRCNSLLYAGAMGIKEGGKFLYPDIAKKSPFLVDHYQDYFNGGLDDMAMWTTYCWPVLMDWMQGAQIGNFCFIQPDPSFQQATHHVLDEIEKLPIVSDFDSSPILDRLSNKLTQDIMDNLDTIEIKKGLYKFSLKKEFIRSPRVYPENPEYFMDQEQFYEYEQELNHDHKGKEIRINNDLKSQQFETNFSSVYSSNFYSYFGRHIAAADLNGDGSDDLIISAPGQGEPGSMGVGCVYVIILGGANSTAAKFTGSSTFDIQQVADIQICGYETHGRFGWSTNTLDFNGDGVLDLVVGAPSHSNSNLNYYGRTFVYFGKLVNGIWSTSPSQPDVTITGTSFHDQTGLMIYTGDCNGDGFSDLILGMPTARGNSTTSGDQRGKVAIFYSGNNRVTNSSYNVDRDCDWYAAGVNDYEWFGYNVQVSVSSYGTYLLVGSPNFHFNQGVPDIGKVTGYLLSTSTKKFTQEPKFTLYGHYTFDKVGYNFLVINGSFVGLDSDEPVLSLGLPTRGYDIEMQVGEVMVVSFVDLQGDNDLNKTETLLTITGDTKFSRFGEALLWDQIEPSSSYSLFVGAPLWTDSFNTGSGCVFTYDSSNQVTKKDSKTGAVYNTIIDGVIVNNNHKDSRFGLRIVMADVNADGKKDLIIGADRDSTKSLEGGSINIFLST